MWVEEYLRKKCKRRFALFWRNLLNTSSKSRKPWRRPQMHNLIQPDFDASLFILVSMFATVRRKYIVVKYAIFI